MITVDITYLTIGGVILLYLLFKLLECKSKIAKPERVYIDSSGISINPPQFMDVLQNKTINFKIGKHHIIIPQITIGDGMTKVSLIATLFKSLNDCFGKIPSGKIETLQLNIYKSAIYRQIVNYIYKLSRPFAKSKRAYKREYFKYAKTEHEKIMLICEQVFDYWMYIKKLTALLAQGGSLRMINGEACTWSSYEMDMTGKRIIRPRFALSTNSQKKSIEKK